MIARKMVPDPTYARATIDASPAWRLAFWLSEIDNDTAPIGWFQYVPIAEALLRRFPTLKDETPGAGSF